MREEAMGSVNWKQCYVYQKEIKLVKYRVLTDFLEKQYNYFSAKDYVSEHREHREDDGLLWRG